MGPQTPMKSQWCLYSWHPQDPRKQRSVSSQAREHLLRLSAQSPALREQAKKPIAQSFLVRDCLLYNRWSEDPVSNPHASQGELQPSQEPREAIGHFLHLLSLLIPTVATRLPTFLWQALAPRPLLLWLLFRDTISYNYNLLRELNWRVLDEKEEEGNMWDAWCANSSDGGNPLAMYGCSKYQIMFF